MRLRNSVARCSMVGATLLAGALLLAGTAQAQWGTDPEEGDTGTPGSTGTTTTTSSPGTTGTGGGGGSTSTPSGSYAGSSGSSSSTASASTSEGDAPSEAPASSDGVRIALQGRFSLVNVQLYGPSLGENVLSLSSPAPYVTAGIRASRLFVGLGFGFFGISFSQCGGTDAGCDGPTGSDTTQSTSAFSITPLASFDLLLDPTGHGALYLLGWIPLVSGGAVDVERCTGSECDTTDGSNDFWWGLNLGLGARYNIVPGIALATEWGWGFLTSSSDGDTGGPADDSSVFAHGIWGNIMFEASIGI